MRRGGLLVIVLCVGVSGSAQAQDAAPEYTPDEFVRAILRGPQPCPSGKTVEACEANPKTRRFTLGATPDAPARRRGPASSPAARPASPIARIFRPKPRLSAQDVLVTFAVSSAEVTPQGHANLRSIAAGLNKPALAAVSFEVAGFTDVSGSPAYNLALSQRRAASVKALLVALDVSPERLRVVGYGSEHLIDPQDPTSELNRRVELHRLN